MIFLAAGNRAKSSWMPFDRLVISRDQLSTRNELFDKASPAPRVLQDPIDCAGRKKSSCAFALVAKAKESPLTGACA